MNDLLGVISLGVGSLALLTGLGKVTHSVYRWMRRVEEALTYVEGEMRHNGGSTIRDAITRIDKRLDDFLER